MPRLWSPLIRLDRLRRSARLAAFVLALFLLRIGMVAACLPSDLAELAHDAAQTEQRLHADAVDTGDDADSKHNEGHCLHCSCHHAVTLPATMATPLAVTTEFVGVFARVPQATAPPDLSLRPPIL